MTRAIGSASPFTPASDFPTWYAVGAWHKERVCMAVLARNGERLRGSQCTSVATRDLPHLLFVIGPGQDEQSKLELGEIAHWCEIRQIALVALDITGARAETLINDFDCMYDYWVRTPFACNDFEDLRSILGDGSSIKKIWTGIAAASGKDAVTTALRAAAAQAGLTNDSAHKPEHRQVSGVLCIAAVNKSSPGQVNLLKQISVESKSLVAEKWDFLAAMVYDPALREGEIRVSIVVVGS